MIPQPKDPNNNELNLGEKLVYYAIRGAPYLLKIGGIFFMYSGLVKKDPMQLGAGAMIYCMGGAINDSFFIDNKIRNSSREASKKIEKLEQTIKDLQKDNSKPL